MRRSENVFLLVVLLLLVGVFCSLGTGTADGRPTDQTMRLQSPGDPAVQKLVSPSLRARSTKCVPCASLRAEKVVERWAWQNFPDSFAGMYVVKGRDLAVGFTQRQAQRVRKAGKLGGVDPHVKVLPFPYVPTHPLAELGDLEHRVWQSAQHDKSIRRKIVSVGINEQANLVDVGAVRGQVKALASLLRARFGQNAPIRVHYEEAPVEV